MRRSRARAASGILLVVAGCREDATYNGFEQVVAGTFDDWPSSLPDGAEGEVWTPFGGGVLARKGVGSQPYLRIGAGTAGDAGGARANVPVRPGAAYRLDLVWRGGPGRVELVEADGGPRQVYTLARATSWTALSQSWTADREGVALLLLDESGGDELEVDDVSLRERAPVEGTDTWEPPVDLVFVVHIEPEVDDDAEYEAWWADLEWIQGRCEERGVRMTVLSNGKFMEWVGARGDEGRVLALLDRGHEVGTHSHAVARGAAPDWHAIDTYDAGEAEQQWADAEAAVDAVVGADRNRTIATYAASALMPSLMSAHGFTLDLSSVVTQTQGGRSRESASWTWLGHHGFHPYRPADGQDEEHCLVSDVAAPYVAFLHAGQVGYPDSHGAPTEVADYLRQLAYLDRQWSTKAAVPEPPGEDLVWAFGVMTHVGVFGDGVEDDLVDLLDALSADWLEAPSTTGESRMRSVVAQDLLADHLAWEAEHPGQTPFSFVLPDPD